MNASERNSTSGSVSRISLEQPLPERHRFGVRVVDAEDPHPVRHPVPDDSQHLGVDALGVVVEVDRVDVLVLLRRVLRVGDGAVGAGGEPLRVLAHPGVVGRGLQRQVEGHLEAELPWPAPRRRRSRAACRGRDGWRRARPSSSRSPRVSRRRRARGQGVVRALAVHLADRVDRREVDHVEAHRGDRVSRLAAVLEGAAARLPRASTEAPSERGKNSYQLLNSARSRSTWSGYGPSTVSRSRSGWAVKRSASSGLSATASRASTGRVVAQRLTRRRRSSSRAPA